jgi:hypothetical protein
VAGRAGIGFAVHGCTSVKSPFRLPAADGAT